MSGYNALALSRPLVRENDLQSAYTGQWLHVSRAKYRKARLRARLARLRSLLKGNARHLYPLDTVRGTSGVHSSRYVGVRTVPICQIRGSENRCEDFDAEFNPLKSHNRWRWLNIATARQKGAALPLVQLIQVGDAYFVRDGHHRISVAKAWGQESIDAEVTAFA